jgi:hypothetical protein
LGLLIIILAVLILAPWFVRRYAEKHSPELIGHDLFVQHFYLSGLTGFIVQEDSVFNFSDLTEKQPDGEPADKQV